MDTTQENNPREERGAMIGIGIVIAILLFGGFFFWKNDVGRLKNDRTAMQKSWYDNSEDTVLQGDTPPIPSYDTTKLETTHTIID